MDMPVRIPSNGQLQGISMLSKKLYSAGDHCLSHVFPRRGHSNGYFTLPVMVIKKSMETCSGFETCHTGSLIYF
jgi:hypothetical protein